MKSYGQTAYEAYAKSTGGLTFDGRQMPEWDDLWQNIQNAWEAAALGAITAWADVFLSKEIMDGLKVKEVKA